MSDSDPFNVTQDHQGSPLPREDIAPTEHPQRIGRYRVEKVLGKGGFGLVYLAHDEQLDRLVAIKVPHARLISKPKDAEAYLAEARTVANLDHPGIVPVHDVGSTEDCPCYVVSKYIDGTDLSAKLKKSRPRYRDAAELVATVAEALHYAHKQGLVHRDVKPGNILIGKDGRPYLVDFGLALREENVGKGPKYAGTPAYMSPEQARGEGHRVDGRSDVFSLGVVFYELLAGRQPFRGDTQDELFEQVTSYEAKPVRQYDDNIPKELERICQKAMAKRASERYSTAKDFAEDVRHFLVEQTIIQSGVSPGGISPVAPQTTAATSASTPAGSNVASSALASRGSSDSQLIKIVPKGLRSFDAHDADFFLELMPGPRDREGLPDSLRFWKTRIEEIDPDNTFSVGLLYGPSGCGKSSLVKAGLLPRLSEDLITVYIEATPDETETRLLHGVRKRCPALEDNLSLKETLAALRRGQGLPVGKKVLIVLDQFEQWLHAKKEEENSDLVQALRQCDGGRLQCIVMVRDDFWLAVSRFLRELEVRLLEGHNSALVDLFDLDHARKVLAAFGRAFGKLADSVGETTKEQKEFLAQSIAGLAEEGKVICVRLALFAEMMKGKTWTPATLKEVGGTKGIGVTFLEETFSSSAASPDHRYHQKAARAVLKDLLPDAVTDIKGYMRSYAELLEASGYGSRPKDFDDLIRILDSEIRLITPTDPEGKEIEDNSVSHTQSDQKYFQLTHDYLVHSLREWLTRKQKETRRGRAELRLAERAAAWNARPQNRHLPSLWEFGNIRLLTNKKNWSEPQQHMMRRAGRVLGVRWGTTVAVLLLIGIAIQHYVTTMRHRNLVERVRTTVAAMRLSRGITVPRAISDLRELPDDLVVNELKTRFDDTKPLEKLSLAYALADYGEGDLEFLASEIADAPSNECPNFVDALDHNRNTALDRLSEKAQEADGTQDWKLKGRLAILALYLGDATLAVDVHAHRPDPTQQAVFIHDVFLTWHGELTSLPEVIERANSAALRAGMCLALGNLPAEQLGDALPTWRDQLKNWYQQSPDSGTHSAAGWALRKWRVELPEISVDTTEPKDRDWKVTPMGREHGFTMVRIPAGQFQRTDEHDGQMEQAVTLTRDLWLSDVEVSVGLFQQFMDDKSYPGLKPKDWQGIDAKISPTSQHPVHSVNWEDAVLFCNWLSQKEERTPCYTVEPISPPPTEVTVPTLTVTLQSDATGYRLPTEAEWEYACRSGTTTDFGFGGDAERLREYAVFNAAKTELVGSKMSNCWGLFDMHGNVQEWCHDRTGKYVGSKAENPTGDDKGEYRQIRGNSWYDVARFGRSGFRLGSPPSHRDFAFGFRVAQVPLPDEKQASEADSESR